MRRLRTIILLGLWLCSLAIGISQCGGSPNPGDGDSRGTAPPLDIPLPISNLMTVSGPDANGVVRVTGAPGAVLDGALVRVSNLGPQNLASRLGDWLLASAWAQGAAVELVAQPDGSFQLNIKGAIGDTLRVVQIVAGQESPPLDLLVTGKILPFDITPTALKIEVAQDAAFVGGPKDDQALVYRLDLSALPGKSPELVVALENFSGIAELSLKEGAGLALAISPQDNGLYRFALDGSEPALRTAMSQPLDVDIAGDRDHAGIALGQGNPSLLVYDTLSDDILCSANLEHPNDGALQALRSPLLRATENAPGIHFDFVVLTQFSDLSWWLSKLRIHGENCSILLQASTALSDLAQAGDLAVEGSGIVAWLSDSGSNRVFRIDLERSEVQSVEVGASPLGLALNESMGILWVVNQGDNSVSAVQLADLSTRTREGVGLAPTQVAIDAARSRALVLSTLDQSVVLVDLDF